MPGATEPGLTEAALEVLQPSYLGHDMPQQAWLARSNRAATRTGVHEAAGGSRPHASRHLRTRGLRAMLDIFMGFDEYPLDLLTLTDICNIFIIMIIFNIYIYTVHNIILMQVIAAVNADEFIGKS